ncbi:hypothetical protein HN011_000423 [Eciton burchellii]|nr:hypothetical protein HN011_000423 [Eciton burchellii]
MQEVFHLSIRHCVRFSVSRSTNQSGSLAESYYLAENTRRITHIVNAHPEISRMASSMASIADRRILGADSGAKSVLSALEYPAIVAPLRACTIPTYPLGMNSP